MLYYLFTYMYCRSTVLSLSVSVLREYEGVIHHVVIAVLWEYTVQGSPLSWSRVE